MHWSALLAFAIGSVALAQQDPPPKAAPVRMPLPEGSAVEEADKLIKDIYKADYAKRKPADKLEFAGKLLKSAQETKDAAARFVMLREARDLAAAGGDVILATEAVEVLAENFVIKLPEQKLAALEAANKARVAAPRVVAEAALETLDDAIRADDYALADQLLKLAASAGSRANVSAVSAAIAASKKELETIHKVYETLEPDRKTLVGNPTDPAANEKIGRFSCFLKGDWQAGLPLLAKSGDERLKAVAELDLRTTAAADRAAVADRWLEEVSRLEMAERSEVRQHAYAAYLDALPELVGLDRTRVEKRLQEIRKSDPKIQRLSASWTVIFRSDDPSIWNTATSKGKDRLAIPLAKVRSDIKYLKLTDVSRRRSAIIEMTAKRLGDTSEQNGIGWCGSNNLSNNARHLGIFNPNWSDRKRGNILIYSENLRVGRGWGFGNRYILSDVQGYTWDGAPIEKTVFEIAVKSAPLTSDETRRLLKSKK